VTPKLVLATRNTGKIAEMSRLVDQADLAIEVLGADAFAALPEVAETGTTFAANALLKARAVAAYTRLPAMADDSGICVDALNGMPGILSARWAGRHGDDTANLNLLLSQLSDVSADRRGAHFFCSVAVALPPSQDGTPGECRVVEGQVDGQLLLEPRGDGGFGYDPIFVPHGHALSTAQMDPREKDAISHRGKAFRAAVPVLRELIAGAHH
jgi:XTP/dITP diphosphohydrolase